MLTRQRKKKREYYGQEAAQNIHNVPSLMDQGISTKHKATRRACEHKHIYQNVSIAKKRWNCIIMNSGPLASSNLIFKFSLSIGDT